MMARVVVTAVAVGIVIAAVAGGINIAAAAAVNGFLGGGVALSRIQN